MLWYSPQLTGSLNQLCRVVSYHYSRRKVVGIMSFYMKFESREFSKCILRTEKLLGLINLKSKNLFHFFAIHHNLNFSIRQQRAWSNRDAFRFFDSIELSINLEVRDDVPSFRVGFFKVYYKRPFALVESSCMSLDKSLTCKRSLRRERHKFKHAIADVLRSKVWLLMSILINNTYLA